MVRRLNPPVWGIISGHRLEVSHPEPVASTNQVANASRSPAVAVLVALVSLVGACANYDDSRQEVADQVAQELALAVEEPLEALMEAGSDAESEDAHESVSVAVEGTLNELDSLADVSRLEPAGMFSARTPDRSAARMSMAAVVVPSDEADRQRYCILAAIHSDGRVEAGVTATDQGGGCVNADLQMFGTSP